MSSSTTPKQQTPSTAENVAGRECFLTRFEGVVQVSAAIVIAATLASGLLFWSTRPIKHRRLAQPVVAVEKALSAKTVSFVRAPDPNRGKTVFSQTCFACHGPTGAGIPGVGAPLRTSKFVASRSDEQLLNFVKVGRQPFDADTVLHLTMPPKGGNPTLDDYSIRDAIAFIRTLQKEESVATGKPIATISQ
jgi:mono/diheme cytochrome c family protein